MTVNQVIFLVFLTLHTEVKPFEFTGKIVKANPEFSYPHGIDVAFWNFLEADDVGAYSSWKW